MQHAAYLLQDLLFAFQTRHLSYTSYPTCVVIGITEEDIYSQNQPDCRFVFSTRLGEKLAVVSTARIDPRFYGKPPAPALLRARRNSMLLKNIGILYYGRQYGKTPSSVLSGAILGVDNLDARTETL